MKSNAYLQEWYKEATTKRKQREQNLMFLRMVHVTMGLVGLVVAAQEIYKYFVG